MSQPVHTYCVRVQRQRCEDKTFYVEVQTVRAYTARDVVDQVLIELQATIIDGFFRVLAVELKETK